MSTLFKQDEVGKIKSGKEAWQEQLQKKPAGPRSGKESFTTVSGKEIGPLYTPVDIKDFDYTDKLGFPGQYPFTRGVQTSMYRGRPWTMRMFAGLGSAEETNERFHYLVSQGQTGLSTAFDMPTLMGYDTDDPKASGECGKCGVAIDTLKDM
ncbi:MAG: hypothetical protein KAV87_22075, partial [Desulfobacteraceae bacterium]|nr:hypothetical protein [Desulfobacteraceae bacterium]